MENLMEYHRFLVKSKLDARDQNALKQLRRLGLNVQNVERYEIYCLLGNISSDEVNTLSFLFCTELTEICTVEDSASSPQGSSEPLTLEVMFNPVVTDTRAREAMTVMREMDFSRVREIVSGSGYRIFGQFTEADKEKMVSVLCNSSIQYCAFGRLEPLWVSIETAKSENYSVEHYNFATMDDHELLKFSLEKKASLDLAEMKKIKDYFVSKSRPCTDVEFETIAQTWSEHCVHKTFKSCITIEGADEEVRKNYPNLQVNNILKTYIKKATDEINTDWVVSAFVDNAGIVKLDENYDVSFKVETHNHPSAIEPFGGANTGVGGVIRDVMGVSARPFAVTNVLCFGPPDLPNEAVPQGSLHPSQTILGVVEGVSDYGNKMGIPTVNGGIHFAEGYTTNPLVYCGCAGIAKHNVHKTSPRVGDHIFALGAPTGRDAIRGATFSSMAVDAATGTVAGAAVQIGDPIIQKKITEVLEVIIEEELYSAITDCGAGGFSSAVGEMSSKLGCQVDITNIPVKYASLQAWERWISESQERMVLAVPEKNCQRVKELCELYDVLAYDLGTFTGDGVLTVLFNNEKVINLDCSFLHSGPPQKKLKAVPYKATKQYPKLQSVDVKRFLLELLADKNICSRDSIVRRYDHEVQGGSLLRPYDGETCNGPQDAAVVQPREQTSKIGVALSNALCSRYSAFGAYDMAKATIDETIRSIVAVGGDPKRIGILDNYCLGDPNRPEVMWDLVESARGCYEAAVAFGTPFISGKDSFYNEYLTSKGQRKAIPASLLISGMGIVPNIDNIISSDLKGENNALLLFGAYDFQFAGSVFAEKFGLPSQVSPQGNAASEELRLSAVSPENPKNYKLLHQAISEKLILSSHDISDGGLLVALAEMCIGSNFGAKLELPEALTSTCSTLKALFGETTGCFILEAAPEKLDALKALLGPSLLEIGKTTGENRLDFQDSSFGLSATLEELNAAFAQKLL